MSHALLKGGARRSRSFSNGERVAGLKRDPQWTISSHRPFPSAMSGLEQECQLPRS